MSISLPQDNYYDEFVNFKKEYTGTIFINQQTNLGKYCDLHGVKYLVLDKKKKKKIYGKNYLIEKYLTKKYERNYKEKYYNLEYNIIRHFPKNKLLKWLETDFESRKICYIPLLHIELVKFVFSIWHTKDTEFGLYVEKIKTHLIDMVNMSREECYDILKNEKNPKFNPERNTIHYTFWLNPYFVLFDNGEELIMKLIDLVNLDGAQEDLLYGIYQMSVERLAPFIKKILIRLWQQDEGMIKNVSEPCFSYFAVHEISMILRKLYKNGYDLINDPEVRELFKYSISGIEKNGLDKISDILPCGLRKNEEDKIKKIYTEYLENENHIDPNSDLGIKMKVRIRKIIKSRSKILKIFNIDSHIQNAKKFIKDNREIILKNFNSSAMTLPLIKNQTILLYISIETDQVENQIIVREYLIFPFEDSSYKYEESYFNACVSLTHEINDIGKYVLTVASCFAYRRFNFNIDGNENDNIADQQESANSQWKLKKLGNVDNEHVCNICKNFIIKGDFRCDVCEDFDICSNCKKKFETNTDKQKKIKDKFNHSIDHALSQRFISCWKSNKYDNFLCFANFSFDNL